MRLFFLIYFSDSLVLLYRKVIDFCTLILYPATYWICLFEHLFGGVFRVFYIYHLQIVIVLLFSFMIQMTFISFSCLIALSRTSRSLLNKSDMNGPPHLVSDFWGKVFNLLPLSVNLPVFGLSCKALICRGIFLLYPIHWEFLMKGWWILCFLHVEIIMWLLSFIPLLWYIYWFVYVESPLHC